MTATLPILRLLPSSRDSQFRYVSSRVIGAWPRDLIERASPSDLMAVASDVSGAPMSVAAILLLDSGSAVDPTAVRAVIADRIRTVLRLRQRFVPAPFGCGRPYWVDDLNFDISNHFRDIRCPDPGDETALLDVAADTVTRRLASSRPLWSATLVTGLADGGAALIVLLHHVIADGVGGLAVLAQLVDGPVSAPPCDFPRRPPGRLDLFSDAVHRRIRAAANLPTHARRLRAGIAELALDRTRKTPPSSLNRPIGSRRSFAVARVDLESIRATGHEHGATVNDIILTAVTGALHTVLSRRGGGETSGGAEFAKSLPGISTDEQGHERANPGAGEAVGYKLDVAVDDGCAEASVELVVEPSDNDAQVATEIGARDVWVDQFR